MKKIEVGGAKSYVWTLDKSKLQGQRNCEIFYVRHKGDFVELSREAYKRNIIITSISMREYRRVKRGGVE